MRVIAGELKGRTLVAPRGRRLRPTADRVREAIFAALGEIAAGARVLDLYCGTGALAIEALSRGAGNALLVDRDTRPALGNVERLGLGDRIELFRGDAERWLVAAAAAATPPVFDLVFVDPPYRLADRVGRDLDNYLPRLLAAGGRVSSRAAPADRCGLTRWSACASAATGASMSPSTARRRGDEGGRGHRRLPGHLRPGHKRSRRHHHPRRADLRAGRRRGRRLPPAQGDDAVSARRSARRSCARRSRTSPTSR